MGCLLFLGILVLILMEIYSQKKIKKNVSKLYRIGVVLYNLYTLI